VRTLEFNGNRCQIEDLKNCPQHSDGLKDGLHLSVTQEHPVGRTYIQNMAESILLALTKVGYCLAEQAGTQVLEEIKKLRELPSKVRKIERELRMMKSSIRQIDSRIDAEDLHSEWIVEVRKLAYRVEDIMDNFTYHALQLEGESFVLRQAKKLHYSKVFSSIASDITQIEEDIQHVVSLRERYIQFDYSNHQQAAAEAFVPQVRFPQFVNDGELVGINSYRDQLTDWLHNNTTEKNNTVITVSGMGGLGKTTLVANVYERAKRDFQAHAWIAMSKAYTVDSLLRTLIRNIGDTEEQTGPDKATSELRSILNNKLKKHKTIVVLDDLWEQRTFLDIKDSFNDVGESRIVITTRLGDVASLARPDRRLELRSLDNKDAYDLFCKRAFANNENNQCPGDLEKLAKDIVQRCQGLPLAIVSIGILLSSRPQIASVWTQVYNQLRYQLAKDDDVQGIINLSYHDLPGELRNCFLYCSMFPQNYYLSRRDLVLLWVAEGFAVKTEESTAEEVAEGYLMELILRNMLQLVEKDELGRVSICKMHDIVRDLAMSIAKKVRFGTTNDSDAMTIVDSGIIRRLSTGVTNVNKQMRLPHLRTLMAHGNGNSTPASSPDTVWSILLESRYLAVLELRGSMITAVPSSVGQLFNLRYLGLRDTKIKFLPHSVEKLSNLLTLDVKSTYIERLPRGIAKVKKLSHLFADCCVDKRELVFECLRGVAAPRALSTLQDLQTFETVQASKELAAQLERLVKLESLSVDNIRNDQCAMIFAAVSKLPLLSSLSLSASNEEEELSLKDLIPTSNKLQRLIVKGKWTAGTLECPIFQDHGGNLNYLEISWSKLGEDTMEKLSSHLQNLTYLSLNKVTIVNSTQHIVIRAGGFPNLKTLRLKDMHEVLSLEIESGAIPSIEALYLLSMTKLGTIPKGIDSLGSLKKLWMVNLHPDFGDRWKNHGWQQNVSHIKEVRMI